MMRRIKFAISNWFYWKCCTTWSFVLFYFGELKTGCWRWSYHIFTCICFWNSFVKLN